MEHKYCPRCIEAWEGGFTERHDGVEVPSECKECGVCKQCEHLLECSKAN